MNMPLACGVLLSTINPATMTGQTDFHDPVTVSRFPTREVRIGGLPLGGTHPVRIQSMTSTDTRDVTGTLRQCIRLFEAGADYVRISVPDKDSLVALKKIRKELRLAGFDQALIADIHFRPELALLAAPWVEKVRINPGNYNPASRKVRLSDDEIRRELEELKNRLAPLLKTCHEYGTAVRIGTNMGSLPPRIARQYGHTPEAMAEATLEFLRVFEELEFHQTVVSLKASHPQLMIRAYQLAAKRMWQEGMAYPMHLGVTEAGSGEEGRARSAIGIAALLKMGLGDTIRVSLTEDPVAEVRFAGVLLENFRFTHTDSAPAWLEITGKKRQGRPPVALDGNDWAMDQGPGGENAWYGRDRPAGMVVTGRSGFQEGDRDHVVILNKLPDVGYLKNICADPKLIPVADLDAGFKVKDFPELRTSLDELGFLGELFVKTGMAPISAETRSRKGSDALIAWLAVRLGDLLMKGVVGGLWLEAGSGAAGKKAVASARWLMQAAGFDQGFTEFISCPTCARTSGDMAGLLQAIKTQIPSVAGLKIAVMGCVVNGPGEMADANFGIMGTGKDHVAIYKGQTMVMKKVRASGAVMALMHLLRESGWIK